MLLMTKFDRRQILAMGSATLALSSCTSAGGPEPDSAPGTVWTVQPSISLDACFAVTIAAASLDVLQARHHEDKREEIRAVLGRDAVEASEHLIETLASTGRKNTPGAALALIVSAGPLDSLESTIATLSTPEALKAGFEGTAFYQDETSRADLNVIREPAARAFRAVAASDFPAFWTETYRPSLKEVQTLTAELDAVDIVVQLRRYLRRPITPEIAIFLTELTEPHGIRIAGQRFVTSPNWSTNIVRRNAVHEMIHSFLEPDRPESTRILDRLGREGLVKLIVEKSNPAFGYSSIKGVIEEDATQALEAVINEQLGQARDQGEYWRKQDGGMHLLAAAIYHRMNQSGFAEQGGDALAWLDEEVASGRFSGNRMLELAAAVVGRDHVDAWILSPPA